MMRRKQTRLDDIAQQLILEKKGVKISPGEFTFISTATPLVWQEIKEWFEQSDSGVSPPTKSAVKQWFYNGCPRWAIATLFFRLKSE